ASLAGLFSSLFGGISAASWLAVVASSNATRAEANADRADAAAKDAEDYGHAQRREKEIARHSLYITNMNLAAAAWENGNIDTVMQILDQYAQPEPGSKDFRSFEWHFMKHLCNLELRALNAASFSFSPTGAQIASLGNHGIHLWDSGTGRVVTTIKAPNLSLQNLAFRPDGKQIAVGTWDGSIQLYNLPGGEPASKLKVDSRARLALAFSQDGTRLASLS